MVSYHSVKFGGHNHSSSGVIMILVCHVILQVDVIKGSYDFMGGSPSWQLMASLVTIGIVVERQPSTCPRFNLPLLFISKGHDLKVHNIHINNSNPGHMCLKQKKLKITLPARPNKATRRKREEIYFELTVCPKEPLGMPLEV